LKRRVGTAGSERDRKTEREREREKEREREREACGILDGIHIGVRAYCALDQPTRCPSSNA